MGNFTPLLELLFIIIGSLVGVTLATVFLQWIV